MNAESKPTFGKIFCEKMEMSKKAEKSSFGLLVLICFDIFLLTLHLFRFLLLIQAMLSESLLKAGDGLKEAKS